jgi:hypothetical protein
MVIDSSIFFGHLLPMFVFVLGFCMVDGIKDNNKRQNEAEVDISQSLAF